MPTTLPCVPLLVESVPAALDQAELARASGARLVEYRVDPLYDGTEASAAQVVRLAADSPLPCIVTCRSAYEGGRFEGHDDARAALIEALCGAETPPKYVDFEYLPYSRSPEIRRRIDDALTGNPEVGLILSAHDFEGRPQALHNLVAAMRATEARVLKIAFRARSLRDNIEVFELLREKDRPTIALGMGEPGLMSRVLAPKFGGFVTFASLRDSSGTAPGQPTLAELTGLYRFGEVGPRTRVYGVVGDPVGHSIGPQVHNAGFEAVGHDGVYLPLPVPGEWEHFKATMLSLMDATGLDFSGASVTIPHKAHLLRLAREDASRRWVVDDLAARVGAANTLWADRDGVWHVTNTDVEGIVSPLREAMGGLEGRRIAVLGAGGVARAAAAGLSGEGATVVVYARDPARAKELVSVMRAGPGKVVAGPWEKLSGCCCEAYVNCTPVGMAGGDDPSGCPLPDETFDAAGPGAVYLDTVYAPAETELIRRARACGGRVVTGVEMFVVQAAGQFRRWTGESAPMELFARVSREALASAGGG